jgi:hypothetical protein
LQRRSHSTPGTHCRDRLIDGHVHDSRRGEWIRFLRQVFGGTDPVRDQGEEDRGGYEEREPLGSMDA